MKNDREKKNFFDNPPPMPAVSGFSGIAIFCPQKKPANYAGSNFKFI